MMNKAQEHLLIGIDGGGTKTHLVLCDLRGAVLAEEKVGRSNIHTSTASSITSELRGGVQKLLASAHVHKPQRIDVVVAGLAGIDHPRDVTFAHDIVFNAVSTLIDAKAKIHVVNDTIIGLYAGAPSGIGICVIAGTGSNCYGRNAKGKEAWAGGLGHVISDEGSGYDIGLRALMAAAKAEDGRGPKTKLLAMILKRYGVKTMRDLVPIVYGTGYGKFEIGQLAMEIQAASQAGDRVAREIAKGAGGELASMVLAVGKKLFVGNAAVNVVLVGGVLQHDPFVQKEMKRLVRAKYSKAKFIIPKESPVMGAIRLAMATIK